MAASSAGEILEIEFQDDNGRRRKRMKTESDAEVHMYQFNEIPYEEESDLVLSVESPRTCYEGNVNPNQQAGSSKTTDHQERMVSLLERIVAQNDIIIEKLSKCTAIYSIDSGRVNHINLKSTNFPLNLPLETEDDMGVLEGYLKDNNNFNLLVSYFSTFGGKNAVKATIHILSTLMTDNLARNYSYKGTRNGKSAFHGLTVNSVIMRAVASSIQGTTFKDVEEVTKGWLKHAADRLMKQRFKKSLLSQISLLP